MESDEEEHGCCCWRALGGKNARAKEGRRKNKRDLNIVE
jgi:hypothetical protein